MTRVPLGQIQLPEPQWPELACVICPDKAHLQSNRTKAVIKNPAIADWFFHHRDVKFIDAYYVGILGATDYWIPFEWQHRGSPRAHGLVWLPNAPDVEHLLSSSGNSNAAKDEITHCANSIVPTCNPAVLPDGSNVADAPAPKTDPHVCNRVYSEIEDLEQDVADLVAMCQRHTRFAPYCLRTKTEDKNVDLVTLNHFSQAQFL